MAKKATKWLPRLPPKVRATIEGSRSRPVLPAALGQLWLLSGYMFPVHRRIDYPGLSERGPQKRPPNGLCLRAMLSEKCNISPHCRKASQFFDAETYRRSRGSSDDNRCG